MLSTPEDGTIGNLLDYVEQHRQKARHLPAAGEDKADWAASTLIAAAAYGIEQIPTTRNEIETRHRLSVLAVALAIHKAKTGKYPESLESISGILGGPAPDDPFTHDSFHYRRHGDDDFHLYSAGPNGKDDGGGGDDLNCGNRVVLVAPKIVFPEVSTTIPDGYLSLSGGGWPAHVATFVGVGTTRVTFVVDARVPGEVLAQDEGRFGQSRHAAG